MTLLIFSGARAAHAQPPSPDAPPATPAQPSSDPAAAPAAVAQAPASDDDERLDPSEPDYSLINLPTALRLPSHKGDFHLVHRFGENLRTDDFETQLSNLFGIDQGATIGLEFRFGLMKHLEGVVTRTNNGRTVQFQGKYDGWHQSASLPLSISLIASAEGTNNFGACKGCGDTGYAQTLGAVFAHEFGQNGAVYLEPFWVHGVGGIAVPGESTGFVGIGARGRVHGETYLVFEVSPRLGGTVFDDGSPEYAFAIEKRVGGHVFQLQLGNSSAVTYAQIARGGVPGGLYFGFNLSRKFF
ncbi:MAG TPA: DUF5777 family beta-barrel protein [Vicinamibacterales bacterium]|nr:DUF5777 family beta-barrel protein [Vicinamibacterales bacterium]